MKTAQASLNEKINERSFIKNREGLKIAYVEQGKGEALILIPGLGRGIDMWMEQIPFLSKDFRTIAIENRGAGQSDQPTFSYTIRDMAEDVVDLMKALSLEKAHIVGASMGGFIAQEFALCHPEKVKSLVLCATSPGGPQAIPMAKETWEKMFYGLVQNPKEGLLDAVKVAFSPEYYMKKFQEITADVQRRLSNLPSPQAWMCQAQAGAAFNAWDRLGKIQSPTLIITGMLDIVVSPVNSRFLHELIPNSKLVNLPGGGHYIMVECSEEINQQISSFCKEK